MKNSSSMTRTVVILLPPVSLKKGIDLSGAGLEVVGLHEKSSTNSPTCTFAKQPYEYLVLNDKDRQPPSRRRLSR